MAKNTSKKDKSVPENLLSEVTEAIQKEDISYMPEEPITINRPVLQFCVLASLAKQGVYFTDVNTGEPINGLLYLPHIGISLTPPETEDINLGFQNLGKKRPKKLAPNTFEVDGVLYFEYEGKECITGKLDNTGKYLWFVKIWNDKDMIIWEEILKKVIAENTTIINNVPTPLPYFIVSSACVPENAVQHQRLVLTKNQINNQSKTPAVYLESPTIPEEEDDDFDQQIHTPIF